MGVPVNSNSVEVIVTGGRDYADDILLGEVLDSLKVGLLIQGGASGADKLAKEWAERNKVPVLDYPADWNGHGKAAGPIRNGEMLATNPDAIVVAFPGGKGTANCVRQALALNRIVLEVK